MNNLNPEPKDIMYNGQITRYSSIVNKLKHWRLLYDYKKKEVGFEEGTEAHIKYLRMTCNQQYTILVRIGVCKQ